MEHSCAIIIYLHIYVVIIDPHNDLLPVGLIAPLVEHCTVIAEVGVQIPVRAGPEVFRPFSLLLKQRENAMIKFIHSRSTFQIHGKFLYYYHLTLYFCKCPSLLNSLNHQPVLKDRYDQTKQSARVTSPTFPWGNLNIITS